MRPSGSFTGSTVVPLMTSVVPMVEFQEPDRTAPDPTCDAQPSVMPSITGTPAGNPVSSAAVAVTLPATVPEIPTLGNFCGSIPNVAKTSTGQLLSTKSKPDFSAVV